jgi:hypothetical protein
MRDLSEAYRLEKNTNFTITENDSENDLPENLFQIVKVTITNTASNLDNKIVERAPFHDYEDFKNNAYRSGHFYSRFENKIKIHTDIYSDNSVGTASAINVYYYAVLPTIDYNADSINLNQSPPIQEEHYQEALIFYINYRYYLNNDDESKANNMLALFERKKTQIDNYTYSHRHSNNTSRKIGRVR